MNSTLCLPGSAIVALEATSGVHLDEEAFGTGIQAKGHTFYLFLMVILAVLECILAEIVAVDWASKIRTMTNDVYHKVREVFLINRIQPAHKKSEDPEDFADIIIERGQQVGRFNTSTEPPPLTAVVAIQSNDSSPLQEQIKFSSISVDDDDKISNSYDEVTAPQVETIESLKNDGKPPENVSMDPMENVPKPVVNNFMGELSEASSPVILDNSYPNTSAPEQLQRSRINTQDSIIQLQKLKKLAKRIGGYSALLFLLTFAFMLFGVNTTIIFAMRLGNFASNIIGWL